MIDPMPRKDLHVPPTAGEAAARAEGYREGLEAAAVYHDRHAEGYSRTRSRLDEAAHRTHAAAIRDMATDK